MVFESLIKAQQAEKRPFIVFFLGVLYSSLGLLFELVVFQGRLQGLFLSITVFSAMPLMHKIITLEETKDMQKKRNKHFLQEHSGALTAFIMLFLGILVSFSLWYIFLPQATSQTIFASQIEDLHNVRASISGQVTGTAAFPMLVSHNLKVLLFSFIFSFFFGAGAIFILTWNASIIAVALGTYVHKALAAVSGSSGMVAFTTFLGTFTYGFFGYMTHGIFEIGSYFVAGLAGGIISVAVIKHDLFTKRFKAVLVDALWLMVLSLLLLVVAGFVESYISSALF